MTPAGKQLLGLFASTSGPAEPPITRVQELIAAIEAVADERETCKRMIRDVARAIRDTEIPEAVAAERARIAEAVRGLWNPMWDDCLAAVLAIVEPKP